MPEFLPNNKATSQKEQSSLSQIPDCSVKPVHESMRNLSLDAYRGFIMLLLVSGGFGFAQLPKTPLVEFVTHQFEHKPWGGAVFYDLIMPAFLFMVGVAMPFSLGRRIERGERFPELVKQTAFRSLRLLLISQIILSIALSRPHLQFHNVLTQVAATSFLCLFLMRLKFWQQGAAALLLLAVHSGLFLLFPGPDGSFQPVSNIGAVIDRFLMGGNYPWPCVNLNFIPETASVLFGLWTGQLLRNGKPLTTQLIRMSIGAVLAFSAGLLFSPLIPINKWLWTASYTLYTTGWSLLGLILFYLIIEFGGIRRPMFPLVVVGMNSLFVYCIEELFRGWINRSLGVFTGGFQFIGTWAPVAQSCVTLAFIWYLAYWLYQKKIFIKA
jgi:heparan-alpha-glucosaminide N-acetyltransferase